jgi:NAD(P)-dependent dehydrogenase (short-subunit alcohol dehydrogenase family)
MTNRPLFDLTDRVALVTGGGTHLGRAMAEGLAAQGARTYVGGRRRELIEETASIIRDQGHWCQAVQMDITDPVRVEEVLGDIATESGPIDIAVCNAGANGESAFPPQTDLDAVRATWESHLLGTVTTANAAARYMIPRGSGSIITVSSVHGSLAADPRLYEGLGLQKRSSLAYQTSKAAIIGLTRNLAAEFGRLGVRVNCISPGHVPKDSASPEYVRRLVDHNALGIKGVPDDMKGAVVLLASDAGRFITGHNLVVDGGWSIW